MNAERLRALAKYHGEQAAIHRQVADLMVAGSPGALGALARADQHTGWAAELAALTEPNRLAEALGGAMTALLVAGDHDEELYARLRAARDSARNLPATKGTKGRADP